MSFERIIDLIVEKASVSREEVLKLVKRKKEEMGGLVTDEGAALLVAIDLGVEVQRNEEEKVFIGELSDEMDVVPIVEGRVKSFLGIKRFEREGGGVGVMATIVIVDRTGEAKLVLWGEHSKIVEKGQLRKGDVVRVVKGYVKRGIFGDLELHVGKLGRVIINPPDAKLEDFPEVVEEVFPLSKLEPGMPDVTVEGEVVEVGPASIFERPNGSKGRMATARITDGTMSVRVVFWDEQSSRGAQLRVGDKVRLVSGYTREGMRGGVEVHMGRAGRIEVISRSEKSSMETYTPLSQLHPGMSSVNVLARVTAKTPVRTFTRPQDGKIGAVADLYLTDGTGWVRISLWDRHVNLLSKVNIGDLLRVKNAYTREDTFGLNLNAGRRATIDVNPPDVPKNTIPPVEECKVKLEDIKPYMANISLDVVVKHVGEAREFQRQDGTTSKMVTLLVEDETGEAPAVAWGEAAVKLENVPPKAKINIKGCYTRINAKGETEIHIGEGATIKIEK
ncbi:MAG: DUF2240 family protein [Candidatus Jordarchaeales archaeon]